MESIQIKWGSYKVVIICISGKNNIAIDAVDFLLKENIVDKQQIVVTFNKNDNGKDSFQKSFRKFCLETCLQVVSLEEIFEVEDLFLVSLEYDQLIPVQKFRSKKLFNIHFSLLPKYKGMFTSALPILFGEQYSGVTLHEIDDGIDTGDIIAQTKFKIGNESTCRDLYLKYIQYGSVLFVENIRQILSGNYTKYPQPSFDSSYYSKKTIDYANLKINLRKTAFEIKNQIRAFNFREYQIPEVFGSMIVSAQIMPERSKLKAGTIINETESYIDLATIDFDIRLNKFSGKKNKYVAK